MSKTEKTSGRIGTQASHVLRGTSASAATKSIAGSALAQTRSDKTTSPRVATTAGKALDNPRSTATTKTLAGSVVTQKAKR